MKYSIVLMQKIMDQIWSFPEPTMAVITENNKWYPLLDDFEKIPHIIAEKLTGENNPIFYKEFPYSTLEVLYKYFTPNSIELIAKFDDYNFISLNMSTNFTWQKLNWISSKALGILKQNPKVEDKFYENRHKLKGIGIYSHVFSYI